MGSWGSRCTSSFAFGPDIPNLQYSEAPWYIMPSRKIPFGTDYTPGRERMQQKEEQSRKVMPGDLALVVMQRADTLGSISEEPDRLTRRFASPAMRHVSEIVGGWMRSAGMSVRQDNIGNLIGRYESDRSSAATLVLGSHLDTVRDAGRYDGPMGVLIAIACVGGLNAAKRRLPFAIEVVAFADEEGLRYHTAYLGSKAFSGTFDPHYRALTDSDDIPLS